MRVSNHINKIIDSLYKFDKTKKGIDVTDIAALKRLRKIKIPRKKEISTGRKYCQWCGRKKYSCDLVRFGRERICKECFRGT